MTVSFSKASLAAVVLLLCFALTAVAQKTDRNEDPGTIRVDTDLVLIDVAVKGREGNSITGLKRDDFAVFEDGVKQQVALFTTTDVPLNIVLMIDTSGSTRNDITLMRRAARRFLEEIRPQDKVSIIGFHQTIQLLAGFTANRNTLEHALSKLEPGSGTALYDALIITIQDLLRRVEGRKALVILSDGVDSFGTYSYSQVVPLVEKSQASLYFLELDTEPFTVERLLLNCEDDQHFKLSRKQMRKYGEKYESGEVWWRTADYCDLPTDRRRQAATRLYEMAHAELSELADRTGGRVYPVNNNRELSGIFSQIAAELRTLYSIGYYSSNDKRDGKWRRLRVDVGKDGVAAITKPGYRAPID